MTPVCDPLWPSLSKLLRSLLCCLGLRYHPLPLCVNFAYANGVWTDKVNMKGRILKMGDSLVISLPRESLLNLGLQEGSEVHVIIDDESGRIIIEPLRAGLADIDPTFARQLDDFIDRYRPALKALG